MNGRRMTFVSSEARCPFHRYKDPIAWLSAATSKALGTPVELAGMQIHDGPNPRSSKMAIQGCEWSTHWWNLAA